MLRKYILLISQIVLIGCGDTNIEGPETPEQLSSIVLIGNQYNVADRPTIAHVNIVDLDQDGENDVLVCDVLGQRVSWINCGNEQTLLSEVSGAVHAETSDIDGDGDLDVLVSVMGTILPSDAHTGKVIILENDGNETFTPRIIAENIQRVTDVRVMAISTYRLRNLGTHKDKSSGLKIWAAGILRSINLLIKVVQSMRRLLTLIMMEI